MRQQAVAAGDEDFFHERCQRNPPQRQRQSTLKIDPHPCASYNLSGYWLFFMLENVIPIGCVVAPQFLVSFAQRVADSFFAATFALWKNKAITFRRFVSDETNEVSESPDDYFVGKGELCAMPKIDSEGFKGWALTNTKRWLNGYEGMLKPVACTYCWQDDKKNRRVFARLRFQKQAIKKFYIARL
jgi:hypothetical protein